MISLRKIKYKVGWICIVLFFPIFLYGQAPMSIPTTSGWGGFFVVAPGAFNAKTNTIANGPPFFRYAGYKKIESIFSSPVSKSAIGPAFTTEINYTFAKSKTQLFLGNRMEDLLRLDVPFGLGVRQELKDSSILSFSVLLTPLFLNFWQDSFVENEDRELTHVNFPGVRLIWDRMFKTGLELSATYRLFKLGEEKNGQWLIDRGELDPDLQHLLVREGNVFRLQALYRVKINRHRLEPSVRYIDENFDGAAMATKGYVLRLNYIYPTPKVIFEATLNYGDRRAKAVNPIYNETLDADRYGVALAGVVPVKMGNSKRWSIVVVAEYLEENANINFFDTKLASVLVGLQYRNMRR
jgi:hypothetical protein